VKVLTVRNVHEALPKGIELLTTKGVRRESRNGPVLVAPWPVVTEYLHPTERVVFWDARDVNVAFLIAEALWMLAGRNDVGFLARYVKDFGRYSDDGTTLHGAYGYRWRHAKSGIWPNGYDQLTVIAERLKVDPTDRRCVLAMWQPDDLITDSKDLPCNDTVTFQRQDDGSLDMTVFCRSNDIIWGAYFANAFHFSVLHEYMAARIGCAVGIYRQISVNYHAYLSTLEPLQLAPWMQHNPYSDGWVSPIPMVERDTPIDLEVREVIRCVEQDFPYDPDLRRIPLQPFFEDAFNVLYAHRVYTSKPYVPKNERILKALLSLGDSSNDWTVAMRLWLQRRKD